MKNSSLPLVSVIVPTKNSDRFLEACLSSIRAQTYPNTEIIVVDNFSTDNTVEISKKYADMLLQKGPERSAQVNYGVAQAHGEYVYKVDSDFTIEPDVVSECVEMAKSGYEAVVVHNSPNPSISWIATLRKFEVDMYKYDHKHSSPRFIKKEAYQHVGGFNESITAGEDYDFRNRLDAAGYKTGFIDAEAIHHGEPKHFWPHMKKYYLYGKDIRSYKNAAHNAFAKESTSFLNVYIRNWRKLVRHPVNTLALMSYTLFKSTFGLAGWISAISKN